MQIAAKMAVGGFTASGAATVFVVRAGGLSMTVRIDEIRAVNPAGAFTIDWGDGRIERRASGVSIAHTYARPGRYLIRISDEIESFAFTSRNGLQAEKDMLLAVEDVGSRVTSLLESCFFGCANLTGVVRFPNVSEVGNQAFGRTAKVEEINLPALRYVYGSSFGGTPGARCLRVNAAVFLQFNLWKSYGPRLEDVYILGSTRIFVREMRDFPFGSPAGARFHCADGILLGDGTFK